MRLFAGIALDEATRTACVQAQEQLRAAAFEAQYEPPEKMHVTLAFLGSVDDDEYDAVARVLDATAARATALTLTLDKLGAFPNERRPRIIYVGCRAQGAGFRGLANALRERYSLMGFSFADHAVAHVTIARVKGGSTRPLPMLDLPASELQANDLALFESVPDRKTTRYVIRHTAPLPVSR